MDGENFEMYSSQMPKNGYRIFRKLLSRIALQLVSRVFEGHFESSRGGGYIPGHSRVNLRGACIQWYFKGFRVQGGHPELFQEMKQTE